MCGKADANADCECHVHVYGLSKSIHLSGF